MAHPFRLIGVITRTQFGNEDFIATDSHHHQQVCDHHDINQIQHTQHNRVGIHLIDINHQCPQAFNKLIRVDR